MLSVVASRLGRQLRVVAVQELFDRPIVGSAVRALGWIPVSHGHGAEALVRAQVALGRGNLVLIYPEGTIPAAGDVVPARRGAAVVALRARVSVIPIGTGGLEKDADRHPRWRRRCATVRIGSPISHARLADVVDEAGCKVASELLLAEVRSLARACHGAGGTEATSNMDLSAHRHLHPPLRKRGIT